MAAIPIAGAPAPNNEYDEDQALRARLSRVQVELTAAVAFENCLRASTAASRSSGGLLGRRRLPAAGPRGARRSAGS
jgi:hypothetical protein